mgnify:FL=1
MNNGEKENNKSLSLGKKKIPSPRPFKGKVNKKYYEPMYGTKSCTYQGGKKGRKTISEILALKSETEFTKREGKRTIYFD